MPLPLVARAAQTAARAAVHAADGALDRAGLLDASARVAGGLLAGRRDLDGEPVPYLVPPGCTHVAVQWGIWRAGGIAVPLARSHPAAEHEHVLRDLPARRVVAGSPPPGTLADACASTGAAVLDAPDLLAREAGDLPDVDASRDALVVYTSGTTGRPKGAVWTHAALAAQMEMLVGAWGWTPADRALLVLPLHHVHGLINVLGCALWAGAVCEMPGGFDADAVWRRFVRGGVTVFMAVPTVYARLLRAWEEQDEAARRSGADACRRMRLMVSGSAALPETLFRRWRSITGHALLERYGMTEIGMALSNPLDGERRPGCVGTPLPGVDVRLVGDSGAAVPPGEPGMLEVRTRARFRAYRGRDAETRAAFRGEWFRTGDVATEVSGSYRILGRASVDVIKTGGYKVSALEIEEVLRGHPGVADCAVVGLADPTWGERVAAAVVARTDHPPSDEELRAWATARLAPYKVPRVIRRVAELPRNALGKVLKTRVRDEVSDGEETA